jgi:hypothetical protein
MHCAAAVTGYYECVDLLVTHGASVNQRTKASGNAPIHSVLDRGPCPCEPVSSAPHIGACCGLLQFK